MKVIKNIYNINFSLFLAQLLNFAWVKEVLSFTLQLPGKKKKKLKLLK